MSELIKNIENLIEIAKQLSVCCDISKCIKNERIIWFKRNYASIINK